MGDKGRGTKGACPVPGGRARAGSCEEAGLGPPG